MKVNIMLTLLGSLLGFIIRVSGFLETLARSLRPQTLSWLYWIGKWRRNAKATHNVWKRYRCRPTLPKQRALQPCQQPSGVKWVEALRASVRPVLSPMRFCPVCHCQNCRFVQAVGSGCRNYRRTDCRFRTAKHRRYLRLLCPLVWSARLVKIPL